MRIATILFVYNRGEHTEKVIAALKNNTIRPEKLFIFQDGPKDTTNMKEWNRVNCAIMNVDWCEKEVIVSQKNKGLAASVVVGVNYVFRDFDGVIVLEDDCVAHPLFMDYAVKSLKKYSKTKEVFAINGYMWPVGVGVLDEYLFLGRVGSWGWATWKDRWNYYIEDYRILARIKENERLNERLKIWGQDLESMLIGNVKGTTNSWAVFWALQCIYRNGICITPTQSLIKNIGFDGTGVHCGQGEILGYERPFDDMEEIVLPDNIKEYEDSEGLFARWFRTTDATTRYAAYSSIMLKLIDLLFNGGSIKDYLLSNGIDTIAIWGRGQIADKFIELIENEVKISCIVESSPRISKYKNIDVVRYENIPNDVQLILVIPTFDIDNILVLSGFDCRIRGVDKLIDDAINNTLALTD